MKACNREHCTNPVVPFPSPANILSSYEQADSGLHLPSSYVKRDATHPHPPRRDPAVTRHQTPYPCTRASRQPSTFGLSHLSLNTLLPFATTAGQLREKKYRPEAEGDENCLEVWEYQRFTNIKTGLVEYWKVEGRGGGIDETG